MALKNFVAFGTFDKNNPIWPAQADLFASVLRKCINELTGLDAKTKDLGSINTGQGVKNSIKVLVSAPKGVDATDDVRIGSLLAIIVANGSLKLCVNSEFQTQTGVASAMIDFSTSLDRAIAQDPPGLIQTPPAAPLITLRLLAKPCSLRGILGFDIVPTADIPNGSTGEVTLDVDTIVGGTGSGGDMGPWSTLPSGGLCDGAFPTVALPGKWKMTITYVVETVTYVLTADMNTSTVEITKNGTPAGSLSGAWPADPIGLFGAVRSFLSGANLSNHLNIFAFGAAGGMLSKFLSDVVAGTVVPTAAIRCVLTILNDTGATWTANNSFGGEFLAIALGISEVV